MLQPSQPILPIFYSNCFNRNAAAAAAAAAKRTMFLKTMYIFLSPLATLNVIRRNGRGCFDFVKENHFDQKANKDDMANVLKLLREIKEAVDDSKFKNKMKTIKIADYFPAKNNDSLKRFLKQDSDYDRRQEALYELLKTVVTDSQKKFNDSLLSTLFTLEYKEQHRWPCVR